MVEDVKIDGRAGAGAFAAIGEGGDDEGGVPAVRNEGAYSRGGGCSDAAAAAD